METSHGGRHVRRRNVVVLSLQGCRVQTREWDSRSDGLCGCFLHTGRPAADGPVRCPQHDCPPVCSSTSPPALLPHQPPRAVAVPTVRV